MPSSRVGYGQRRVRVTPELIEAWLVGGKSVVTDLPEDARLCAIWPPQDTDTRDTVTLVFESEEWDELAEAGRIPLLTPEVVEPDNEAR